MSSIKKNFFYSSILTTANYLFPLLTYPYVSRVLGVTNIGIVNFIDSIIQYFILVSMLGVNVVGIREVAKCNRNREQLSQTFSGLFWLNTITTIIALVLLLFVTLIFEQIRVHWHLVAIGALKLLLSYMLIEWLYKGLEEFKYITYRTILVKILYVVAVFVFVQDENDYQVYYLLTVLMIVLNSVVNLIYSKKYVSFRIKRVEICKYIKPFFILGVYTLLTSMYISLNVTWLGFVSGETEVGYYTTASKLYYILIALFSAFTGVMLPKMSSLLAEGENEKFKTLLTRAYSILFSFSIPLIIFAVIYAPEIILIISGPNYEGAIIPMRIMMPLILIIGYEQILVIQTLMPLKKDRAILKNSIVGAITGVLLNFVLVPRYASIGAALVWIVSEIVVLLCAQHFVTRYIKMGFPLIQFLKLIGLNIPLAVILWSSYVFFDHRFSIFFASVITVIYVLLSHTLLMPDSEIMELVKTGKQKIKANSNG